MYPGYYNPEEENDCVKHLQTAGLVSTEVKNAVDLLVQRAISNACKSGSNVSNYTFVARDQIQYNLMKQSDFGEKIKFHDNNGGAAVVPLA
jgi:hypothetical protein